MARYLLAVSTSVGTEHAAPIWPHAGLDMRISCMDEPPTIYQK